MFRKSTSPHSRLLQGLLFLVTGAAVTWTAPLAAQEELSEQTLLEEAELMLARGDSLLQLDKPVAALAMYRGAEERSFDPCQMARAHVGIARIYVDSQNPDLASKALVQGESGFLACDEETRRMHVMKAADLWLELNQESLAIELVQRELALSENNLELSAQLANLWFTGGHWAQAESHYAQCLSLGGNHVQRADWLSATIQIMCIQQKIPSEALIAEFEAEATALMAPEAQGHREQIHLVLSMQGMHVPALAWAEKLLEYADSEDPSLVAVAHLRIANSAQQAHRPLKALIGFHEAIKSARQSGDLELLAEVLRQKGLFERERGNTEDALEAFVEVDAINSELLLFKRQISQREARQFNEEVLPAMDPFDRAVVEVQRNQQAPYRSTSWPWIAGFLAIGLIAYSRSVKALKSSLHKERRRIIRLRSLVPVDRLPNAPAQMAKTLERNSEETEMGSSSLMPNGDLVFTNDTDPKSQSIQTFLNELDADLRVRIECELTADDQLNIGPEVRVVLRNLLRGIAEITSVESPIQLGIEAKEKSYWKLRLNSHHTETSKALEGLFYGKDALASSRWNEFHAQLRKLAGTINIERLSPLEERMTVTLPYL